MRRRVTENLSVGEKIELELFDSGMNCIVGCDEAGRGPLAGPVVAAAVVFHDCGVLWRCKDSKSLTATQRTELFTVICKNLSYAVVAIDHGEIDSMNIRVASLTGMARAVKNLKITPDVVLVDGRDRLPEFSSSRAIVKGDSRVATIAAASIVAKVSRDRLMLDYHEQYPEYGFNRHFGYPTAAHRAALKEHGPCPIHRRSYRGVRELVEAD